MSHATKSSFAILLPALLVLACAREEAAGPDPLVEQAIEASAGPDAPAANAGNGQETITIETEDGLYTATSGDDLPRPPGFPADVALPADARILTSMTLGANASISLHSPRSAALVFDEFRRAQRAAGWRELEAREQAPVQSLGFEKQGRHLEADFVAEPGGGTTVAVSVRPVAD